MTQFEPAMAALRRFTQATMFGLGLGFLLFRLCDVVTFPAEDHPWLVIAGLASAVILPVAIWCAELTRGRTARVAQICASWFAAIVGAVLVAAFSTWAGSLFARPYSGPMSAEAMIFELGYCSVAGTASAFLALSPIFLDRQLIAAPRRRTWSRYGALAVSIVAVLGFAIGPRLTT